MYFLRHKHLWFDNQEEKIGMNSSVQLIDMSYHHSRNNIKAEIRALIWMLREEADFGRKSASDNYGGKKLGLISHF